MLFSSVTFLFLFLPIVFALHFVLKGRAKNYLLLLASLSFYAWGEPVYVFLMLFSSLVNFFLAFPLGKKVLSKSIALENSERGTITVPNESRNDDEGKRKIFLVLMVIFNIGLLFVFKYTNFFLDSWNTAFQTSISVPEIVLPIGISFYTFQTMSYMLDVYRGDVPVQRNYADLLLYITFFPQLIAGPIVKYHDVDEQIRTRSITWPKIKLGLQRFILGLAKKLIIANQMAIIVDTIYNASAWNIQTAWLSAFAYAFQIYFDFSGYSDMAIGLGLLFGFKFRENFDYPYISKSIREFWRRWHISLSTWFKEYLYIPLGGSRKGEGRTILNYFIVFFCTGLWHGASWNFVIWGLFQWLLIVLERSFLRTEKWPKLLSHLYTIFFILIGFVIFRVESMKQLTEVLQTMFFMNSNTNAEASIALQNVLTPLSIFVFLLAFIASTPLFKRVNRKFPRALKSLGYLLLWIACVFTLSASTYNPFIYFRF